MEVRCTEGTFVHAEGAQRGSPVPGVGFCPQAGAFLWMRRGNSNRLSTRRVLSVEVRCREWAFVHRRGHFCGCGRGFVELFCY